MGDSAQGERKVQIECLADTKIHNFLLFVRTIGTRSEESTV